MEEVGPVPQRAPVGHGPRGLQRRRQRVGLLLPRPVALARLPLGRRRPRRHLRRQAAAVLRARAVERAGPDPQGAPVRADQQRGQSRRGREGVLLLRRQHADALVHEVSSTSTRSGSSRIGTSSRRTAGARARSSSTSCSTPASSTTTATSTCSSSTPRAAPKTSSSGSPSTTAGRRRRGFTCCRRSGSATPGRGAMADREAVAARGRARHHRGLASRRSATTGCPATARRSCCSPRTRATCERLWGQPQRLART